MPAATVMPRRARSFPSFTCNGRTITARKASSPTDASSATSSAQREVTRLVVAALSPSDGITNCGGGPGLGPTANVNAPRTGCPSAEITRHQTRYQPWSRWRSLMKIEFSSSGAVAGLPTICW